MIPPPSTNLVGEYDFSTPKVWCNSCSSYSCEHSPSTIFVLGVPKLCYSPEQIVNSFQADAPVHSSCELDVRAFSHNVRSFTDSDDNSMLSETREAYLLFLNELPMPSHFCFFQETRSPHKIISLKDYICVSSGCQNFSLGVEIWICKTLIFLSKSNGCVRKEALDVSSICVIHKDPRILLSSATFGSQVLYLCNVHGPHSKFGNTVRIQFWKTLGCTLHCYVKDFSKLIMMGDFNCKLGVGEARSVGSLGSDTISPVGKCIAEVLDSVNLFCPSTFASSFKGSNHHTYTHWSGTHHRIDFSAIHSSCINPMSSTIDVTCGCLGDHDGICTSATLVVSHSPSVKSPKFDPDLFSDASACQSFNVEIEMGSFNSPWADATSRIHYFNNYVHQALCNTFPMRIQARNREYISDATRFIILQRKAVRRHHKRAVSDNLPTFVVQHYRALFLKLRADARASARKDFRNVVDKAVSNMNHRSDIANLKQFFSIKNSLAPKRTMIPKTVISSGSVSYSNDTELATAFEDHFVEILDGNRIDLVSACRSFLIDNVLNMSDYNLI